ncbi:thermitase, putative [Perkinsus marinus ATCC 50983]|uniref:subtilisin n=1 Tax=Perkinsus marinus (strain ATCC 50983 / TXsc) TaxID=423536 RepID=C5LGJ2_PERM5|nr:thermitase, putative [Perkinsus marinus ATCC 50983]EER04178.1 thermitase, putative [Perkinsus marinus ATCC 50983]|eukprot:XP_002772362.1 thermitase, putative [Perkinsus marinus ATCC 50983]
MFPNVIHLASLAVLAYSERSTLISIKHGADYVDVRHLPEMLRDAGLTPDPKIVTFLDTTEITSLEYVHTQVVKTSASSIDSGALCSFVTSASRNLALRSECAIDQYAEIFSIPDSDEYDKDLHVNDRDARFQSHLKWMKMGEVWQLLLPHVQRAVKVAVIDFGIDWTDPDFAPLKATLKKRSGGVVDGGWNFVTDSSVLTDPIEHGTHICRVLAAKSNNSVGLAGVAPNVTLVPLQIAIKRRLDLSRVLEAIDMAIDLEVDIVSMSFGFSLDDLTQESRYLLMNALYFLEENDIIFVSAAGNAGIDASEIFPCSYGGPFGICVAFLDDDKKRNVLHEYSNWGDRVDVAAYGTRTLVGRYANGALQRSSGSSVAAPLVAGLAAILLSMSMEPIMVKRLILLGVEPVKSDTSQTLRVGGGAINPLRTVQEAIRRFI